MQYWLLQEWDGRSALQGKWSFTFHDASEEFPSILLAIEWLFATLLFLNVRLKILLVTLHSLVNYLIVSNSHFYWRKVKRIRCSHAYIQIWKRGGFLPGCIFWYIFSKNPVYNEKMVTAYVFKLFPLRNSKPLFFNPACWFLLDFYGWEHKITQAQCVLMIPCDYVSEIN